MAMLNDRLDEATETLARERTVLELAFLETDENGVQWGVWLQIQGEHGEAITTSPHAIDADHIAYDEQCKEPGWRLAYSNAARTRAGAQRAVAIRRHRVTPFRSPATSLRPTLPSVAKARVRKWVIGESKASAGRAEATERG